MQITVENGVVAIFEINELKRYQVSQFEFYGFRQVGFSLTKESSDLAKDLFDVNEFLRAEGVEATLSAEAFEILNNFERERQASREVLQRGSSIKDGIFDPSEFEAFERFVQHFPRRLKEHQLKAAFHFYQIKNGANFSVPGSGKTSVVLSVYEKFRQEGKCNTLFIIGPTSCFQPWKNEFIETLGRTTKSIILSGGIKDIRKSEYFRPAETAFELYLCTYQTALSDYLEIAKFLSQQGIKALVVIDEAHYMKQIGGAWATALMHIGRFAESKCVLTGTPIPKSYKDVFNLFEFLWSSDFPLNERDKVRIELLEKQSKNDEVKLILDSRIGPLFYRVRKKDLKLKPRIFHPPFQIKMNKHESAIYHHIKSKIADLAEKEYFQNQTVLENLWRGRMVRLRQALSYPKLLLTALEGYSEDLIDSMELGQKIRNYEKLEIPGKLRVLIDFTKRLRSENKKVLIWSNFVGTLEVIRDRFVSEGERCEIIYGRTPVRKDDEINFHDVKTREDIRDEFVDPSSGLDILIANPAACAESISLHKTCFNAIYHDLSYNCAQYIQSLDRIHRVGGSEIHEANYYFLQYENSLDNDIKLNLEAKAEKMYDLIDKDYVIYDLNIYDDSLNDDLSAYVRLFKSKVK